MGGGGGVKKRPPPPSRIHGKKIAPRPHDIVGKICPPPPLLLFKKKPCLYVAFVLLQQF